MWNPSNKHVTGLIIPEVSLRDELKTDDFGIAVIELICIVGILQRVDINSYPQWNLVAGWEDKVMYLCMDGLSLDRHRSFQKRLVNLPISFTKAFKQAITFQKALSCVIDIPGPLHIAFHMLQCVYTVFGTLLKLFQNIVEWKKLCSLKVSECYNLARQLCCLDLLHILH